MSIAAEIAAVARGEHGDPFYEVHLGSWRRHLDDGRPHSYRELLNSDAAEYGGSATGNLGEVASSCVACHGREHSLELRLPPLAAVVLRPIDQRGD